MKKTTQTKGVKRMFNGLEMHMGTLPLLSGARTRSISPENPDGAKGGGGRCELENGSPFSYGRRSLFMKKAAAVCSFLILRFLCRYDMIIE